MFDQNEPGADPMGTAMAIITAVSMIMTALYLFSVVIYWKIYTKAGQPGWPALIPIYDKVVLHQVIGRPGWHVLLYFVPFANIYVTIMSKVELCQSFGRRSTVDYILAIFCGIFYLPYLAFSSKIEYIGPAYKRDVSIRERENAYAEELR